MDLQKVYAGRRGREVEVKVGEDTLNPRLDLANHSPTGFNWGYNGSGPAQLALAILADYLGDDEKALALYQSFKRHKIAVLVENEWLITGQEIESILQEFD